MKVFYFLFFIFPINGHSQSKLDTSWLVGIDKFRLVVNTNNNSINEVNSKVILYKNKKMLLTDSLLCSFLKFQFDDINKDSKKDFLIYKNTGARTNLTYYLFLYIEANKSYKRVVGYDEWPNVGRTKIKNILVSEIRSGTYEYKFFKLLDSGKLINLDVSQVDNELDGNGYEKGLKRARKLLQKKTEAQQ